MDLMAAKDRMAKVLNDTCSDIENRLKVNN